MSTRAMSGRRKGITAFPGLLRVRALVRNRHLEAMNEDQRTILEAYQSSPERIERYMTYLGGSAKFGACSN